jgi:hypothetical protein
MKRKMWRIPVGPSESGAASDPIRFLLPTDLIDLIQKSIPSIVDEEWEEDRQLSQQFRTKSLKRSHIALAEGRIIDAPFLFDSPDPMETFANVDLNDEELNAASAAFGLFDREALISRAYAGWLLSNTTFLEEHDQLLSKHADAVAIHGIPRVVLPQSDPSALGGKRANASPKLESFVNDFEEFFVRWQIFTLVAPYFPWPLGPQQHICTEAIFELQQHQMGDKGSIISVPFGRPLPNRKELREQMEVLARSSDSDSRHLDKWTNIVSSDNSGKKTLARYGLRFRLMHFWTVLFDRHGHKLRGKKKALRPVFVQFLLANRRSDDTIGKELTAVSKQLGRDWYHTS